MLKKSIELCYSTENIGILSVPSELFQTPDNRHWILCILQSPPGKFAYLIKFLVEELDIMT